MTTVAIREGRFEQWGWALCGLIGYIWLEAHQDLHFWRYPLLCGIGAAVVLAATLFPNRAIIVTAGSGGVEFTLERSCFGFWKTRERRTLAAGAQVTLAFAEDSDEDVTCHVEFADGSAWRAPTALLAQRAHLRAYLQEHGIIVRIHDS